MNELVQFFDSVFKGRAIKPSQCISSDSRGYFLVEDNRLQNQCVIIDPEGLYKEDIDQFYFGIHNPNLQSISLWAIDGCFMGPQPGKRCDCILFTKSVFCFIEFKVNVQSSAPQSILEHRNRACLQLRATIEFLFSSLSSQNIPLNSTKYEAYVCSPPRFPDKDTSMTAERIHFLEKYGVMLFEANEKTFD
jgi:hypothetical protein